MDKPYRLSIYRHILKILISIRHFDLAYRTHLPAGQLGDRVNDVLGSEKLGVVDQQRLWRSCLFKESNQLIYSCAHIGGCCEINHGFNETVVWLLASLSCTTAELLQRWPKVISTLNVKVQNSASHFNFLSRVNMVFVIVTLKTRNGRSSHSILKAPKLCGSFVYFSFYTELSLLYIFWILMQFIELSPNSSCPKITLTMISFYF